ncbi:Beta-tubulin folding cofactor D [Trachipleistophora hominis]|uniref:Beta-tubulin folding cofactor D n=1 Tax=Trachipleistophora hominis TaxID=72359 RepID=L7JX13_TRAHO|nr:Beta-tubulin folding cofactor D [Trachipleistophora hominis]
MPEVVEDVLLKTIFFENKNKHAQRMRETALFLVYCMLRSSFNDEIDDDNCVDDGMLSVDHQCSVITLRFLKNVLLSVSLFDNQLECRRAASSILIDLQARKKIEFLPFIDFYSVKRKNNVLNLPQEHYKGLLEQRMTRKIFDYDLEMQIICLEWMKRHRKGITLKKTIKKDEYNLCDLVERYDLREGLGKQEGRAACTSKDCNTDAINEPISYTTALIAYLFLNQIEKIQIDFDEFLLEDKKFAFFADAYLKSTIFKNFDFKGECSFYDMVENVITPNNRRVSSHSSPFKTYYIDYNTENSVNDQNLVFLLDNNSCPHLTMFLYSTLDSDFLFKRLVKRRSLSYFLINVFNTKYFAEYLELVKGMLNDRDVERTRIGMNCIYMMYRLYGDTNVGKEKDDINVRKETDKDDINVGKEKDDINVGKEKDDINVGKETDKDDGKNILYELLYHAIDTNLNNYMINYKGDVGYQCRKESFFLLFYLKDQRVNYYIIKYLFDKNKELREIVISFLREIGVFKNVKGYKTVYISGRRVCRGVEHLLSSAVKEDDNTRPGTLNNDTNSDVSLRSSAGRYESANLHGTLENVGAADCSLIDDSTASFLRSVDTEYENVCSTMSGEKALFKGAFLNFSILEMKHRAGFTKAILSYFVNCDGSIYEILSWGINKYLIDYLVYVLKGTRREIYYVLRSIIILLDHSHQIDSNLQNDGLTNRIRNVQELRTCICGINDEKLNGMRDEIIQKMQWT